MAKRNREAKFGCVAFLQFGMCFPNYFPFLASRLWLAKLVMLYFAPVTLIKRKVELPRPAIM